MDYNRFLDNIDTDVAVGDDAYDDIDDIDDDNNDDYRADNCVYIADN